MQHWYFVMRLPRLDRISAIPLFYETGCFSHLTALVIFTVKEGVISIADSQTMCQPRDEQVVPMANGSVHAVVNGLYPN